MAENRFVKFIFELLPQLWGHVNDSDRERSIEIFENIFVWCSKDVKCAMKIEEPDPTTKQLQALLDQHKQEDPDRFRKRRNTILNFIVKNLGTIY